MPQLCFPLVLIANYGKTSTLHAFLQRKQVNHDLPVQSIPLVCSLCLSQTVNWALRSLVLKKQESLGSLSRDNSRPFFVCSHCNETPRKSVPQLRAHAWTNGFVYILISSMLVSSGAPRDGRDHLLSVSVIYMLWLSHVTPWLIRNEGRLQRITLLLHGTFSMHVYVTNLRL